MRREPSPVGSPRPRASALGAWRGRVFSARRPSERERRARRSRSCSGVANGGARRALSSRRRIIAAARTATQRSLGARSEGRRGRGPAGPGGGLRFRRMGARRSSLRTACSSSGLCATEGVVTERAWCRRGGPSRGPKLRAPGRATGGNGGRSTRGDGAAPGGAVRPRFDAGWLVELCAASGCTAGSGPVASRRFRRGRRRRARSGGSERTRGARYVTDAPVER